MNINVCICKGFTECAIPIQFLCSTENYVLFVIPFKPIDVGNKTNQCRVGYHAWNRRANLMKGLNEVSEYSAHYYNNGVVDAEIYP